MKPSDEIIAIVAVILDEPQIVETDDRVDFIIGSAIASMKLEMINKLIDYNQALVVCVEDNMHLRVVIK